jgi:hypothetical protein
MFVNHEWVKTWVEANDASLLSHHSLEGRQEECESGQPLIRRRFESYTYGLQDRKFTATPTWWNLTKSLVKCWSVYLQVRPTLFSKTTGHKKKNSARIAQLV